MTFKVGSHVIFIDELRKEHDALVETFHGGAPETNPSINLIRIVEENGTDVYGYQKKHETSVVHISSNSAKANCWKRSNE